MDIQQLFDQARQALSKAAHSIFPSLTDETVRYGGAALLAVAALLLILIALRLFRGNKSPKRKKGKRINVPRVLQQNGATVDILRTPNDEIVPLRCVITAISGGKIKCEIIERQGLLRVKDGGEVTCVFSPMRSGRDGKINAFRAKVMESDRSGKHLDRIVLSKPTDYMMIPRRKQGRKRVADQQFIRVKLWLADPFQSDLLFEDAAPQIGINSFGEDGSVQSANAVVNISDGGIGLLVRNQLVPETCTVGTPVTINLFMFNFRERAFRPFWYSGRVRSLTDGSAGFVRMGVEFDGLALPNERTGILSWERF
ncbi:PilZ domain-containing protein [Pseudodesulfovibrio sp.]|uniref:PilZ domain-containing protein n=1 Tax=unclassified Pseudodesulfovibrio TaxID=2661612 RepID=UPI003B000EF2